MIKAVVQTLTSIVIAALVVTSVLALACISFKSWHAVLLHRQNDMTCHSYCVYMYCACIGDSDLMLMLQVVSMYRSCVVTIGYLTP